MKKSLLLLLPLILAALLLGGCGWINQLQEWKNGETIAEESTPDPELILEKDLNQAPSYPTVDVIDPDKIESVAVISQVGDTKEISLYFASADGKGLKEEKRSIPKEAGLARATLNQLIYGPKEQDLFPTIPANTILQDINIRDGLCTVDFSDDLTLNYAEEDLDEELTVYSIVNTLSQFPTVEEVIILIDGQPVPTLAGAVDVSGKILPRMELIER
ncbi:MAG: GerMN domain-containing protein [Clostridiales bacterium]|jgi:sulfur carrier protein ThiS|nr:GerMN domain-containing protein [Clostridiales bacterium]MDR2713325.1 GerMN domain-containing protein [Clostridiales bacterium]